MPISEVWNWIYSLVFSKDFIQQSKIASSLESFYHALRVWKKNIPWLGKPICWLISETFSSVVYAPFSRSRYFTRRCNRFPILSMRISGFLTSLERTKELASNWKTLQRPWVSWPRLGLSSYVRRKIEIHYGELFLSPKKSWCRKALPFEHPGKVFRYITKSWRSQKGDFFGVLDSTQTLFPSS